MSESFTSDLFKSEVTICLDFGSLSSYVGLEPTIALCREFNVSIGWYPLCGNLDRLSSKQPEEDSNDPLAGYKARRFRARSAWAKHELERNCETLGISVDAGAREVDSTLLALGLLFTSSKGGDEIAYAQRAYHAAFNHGADVESIDGVARVVASDGFKAFAEGEGKAQLDALQGALLEAGVFNSPAYVYRGERYQGRQHLPLLRWYLGGSNGAPPV